MSYNQDHDQDHDYAGEATYERWEREHPAEPRDTDEPYKDEDERIESDDDDGDGVDDGDEMIAAKRAVERHLKQTADAVDRLLGEGRR